jgi:hypothetical protein
VRRSLACCSHVGLPAINLMNSLTVGMVVKVKFAGTGGQGWSESKGGRKARVVGKQGWRNRNDLFNPKTHSALATAKSTLHPIILDRRPKEARPLHLSSFCGHRGKPI